jgi:hypothetical protein
MKIDKIISFLTYPGKHADDQPTISGAVIPKSVNKTPIPNLSKTNQI